MKNHTNKLTNKLEGVISISSKGTGYVKVLGYKDDIEIDFKHLNTALHGDIVEIILHPLKSSLGKRRKTGEVIKIISRAKTNFAGVLEEENKLFFLKPDDTKMYTDILIQKEALNNAKVGQKVFAEIISWKDSGKAPIGKVIKILGRPGDNDTEMQAIAIEKGFDSELPRKVEEEAKKIKRDGIKDTDYAGRRDFRKTLTFTIDPSDAKDFDDAISFREINKDPRHGGASEYEIGIHIADVSHYVKIGSRAGRGSARTRNFSLFSGQNNTRCSRKYYQTIYALWFRIKTDSL